MLANLVAASASYVMPASAPTVAPRLSAPSMAMTDPRFPAAGKGLLPDGRVSAIPFLTTPAHLDGTYAGDNVRRSLTRMHPVAHPAFSPREPPTEARP